MKRLFLMCGIAFSGKSTLAREIAEEIGAAIIGLDEINSRRRLGLDGQTVSDEEWIVTHGLALEELERAMAGGQDIILDDTNCFRWLRDKFREDAFSHGYLAFVVYVKIDFDLARQRLIANGLSKPRPQLPLEYFSNHLKSFEPPGFDEKHLVYEPGLEPKRWMQHNGIRPKWSE